MAYTLTFEGEQIGDHLIKVVPADHARTLPAVRTGLYQQRAAINTDSTNYLYARQFHVTLKRGNPVLLDRAVLALQELQGRTGDIDTVQDADTVLYEQWTIESVDPPDVADGFGGRYARSVVITAIGVTRPRYS